MLRSNGVRLFEGHGIKMVIEPEMPPLFTPQEEQESPVPPEDRVLPGAYYNKRLFKTGAPPDID